MERRCILETALYWSGRGGGWGTRGWLSLHSCRSPSPTMSRIWRRSRVSPPRKTWSARKSRKLGMVIGIALIDVIGVALIGVGVVLIGVIGAVSAAAIILTCLARR